jgi:hypothetical protein
MYGVADSANIVIAAPFADVAFIAVVALAAQRGVH